MICPTTEQITAYLHGNASEHDSGEIERHLAECEECEQAAIRLDASGDSLMRHLSLTPDAADQEDWQSYGEMLRQLPGQVEQAARPTDAISLQKALRPNSVYHYRLGHQLGHGGMGVVYHSHHPQLHRPVAVKILSASRAADAPSIARFQREMRAAGALDHPGIVRAVDAGVWQGTYYLVMEYVDGIDLSRLVRQSGPLSAADASAMMLQAAEALHYAHQNQVIHRDVKPSNLMLTREGTIKILDFGLARLEHSGLTNHDATTAGRLVGTLDYLAPEQAAGKKPIDLRADIYGLGATLFKLLSGRPPHGSSQDRPILEHLQRLTTTDADSLESIRSDLDPKFFQAVATMLARDPDDRPESAEQVCQLLQPFAPASNLETIAAQSMARVDLQREQESQDHSSDSPDTRVNIDAADMPSATDSQHTPANQAASLAIHADPSGQPGRGGLWGVFLASLALGLLGGWGAVTLWLQTGEAKLKIESEVDDVALQLIQDGKIATEIEVRSKGKDTYVRAGRYELKIGGEHDNIRLDQRSLLLLRGDERLVRITRDPNMPSATTPPPTGTIGEKLAELEQKLLEMQTQFGQKHAKVVAAEAEIAKLTNQVERIAAGTASAPTSRGRNYQEWLEIVLLETDAPTVAEGIAALVDLSTEENYADTFQTLLTVAQQNEKRCKQPVCDAYIRYFNTGRPGKREWERVYISPDKAWAEVTAAVDKGLQRIRPQVSDEYVNLVIDSGSQASRRIVLVSEMGTANDLHHQRKLEMCKRLAQKPQPPMVRALAHHFLLDYLEQPADENTQDALLSDDDTLAQAISLTLLLQQQYPFPEEQGAVCGRLIASGAIPPLAEQIDYLIADAANEGQEYRGRDSCLLLESVGSSIVRTWSKESTQNELFAGVGIVTRLATVDLMMAATRRSASQQLRFYLTQQLTKRNSRKSHLENSGVLTAIFQTAEALTFLDGELPDELQTLRMNADSAIGKAFDQWSKKLAADPEISMREVAPWFMQYPLETASVAMKLLGTNKADDLEQKNDPRYSTRRRSNPLDQLVPPWLAIRIAGSNADDPSNQIAINRVLGDYCDDSGLAQSYAIVPKGYGKDLYRIAQAGTGQPQQGFALRLALECDYDEKKVAELALSTLLELTDGKADKKLSPDQVTTLSWCLDCINTAALPVKKEQAKTFSTYVLQSRYYGTMIHNGVMARCFRCALAINRRSQVSSDEDGGLLKASLGIRLPDLKFLWARPRSSNEENGWYRFALPVPKSVTSEALRHVVVIPTNDEAVLQRLKSMRSFTLEHGIRPEETDVVKLLEKALAAVEARQESASDETTSVDDVP